MGTEETMLFRLTNSINEAKEDLKAIKNGEAIKAALEIAEHVIKKSALHDNDRLIKTCALAIKLQYEKENFYGDSWRKHGDVSAFMNIERKWDRSFNIMKNVIENGVKNSECFKGNNEGESLTDTVFDMGIYCFMWVGYILENHLEAGEAFISGIKRFLGDEAV